MQSSVYSAHFDIGIFLKDWRWIIGRGVGEVANTGLPKVVVPIGRSRGIPTLGHASRGKLKNEVSLKLSLLAKYKNDHL